MGGGGIGSDGSQALFGGLLYRLRLRPIAFRLEPAGRRQGPHERVDPLARDGGGVGEFGDEREGRFAEKLTIRVYFLKFREGKRQKLPQLALPSDQVLVLGLYVSRHELHLHVSRFVDGLVVAPALEEQGREVMAILFVGLSLPQTPFVVLRDDGVDDDHVEARVPEVPLDGQVVNGGGFHHDRHFLAG